MNLPPLKAVLFDMDGLMIDSERVSREAWQDAARELSRPLGFEVIASMTGLSVSGCTARLAALGYSGPDTEKLITYWRRRYRERLHEGEVQHKPGIIETLQWVKAAGLKCAVASSTERVLLDLKLDAAGLAGYFDATVAGNEVTQAKPAPDVYLAAAQRLAEPVECCVALEDSPIGMQSALAAGIPVIQVPDLLTADEPLAKQALAICNTLLDTLPVLQARMQNH